MSYRRQPDIYDDTSYGQAQQQPTQQQRSSSRRRGMNQQQQQQHLRGYTHNEPYYNSSSHPRANPQEIYSPMPPIDPFMHFGHPAPPPHHVMDPFAGIPSLFHNMMTSVDRMFQDIQHFPQPTQNSSSSSSSYFYESRTRTVGPDGVVREEVVREQPGADGQPETTRQVRQTDQYGRVLSSDNQQAIENDDQLPDVVVEELDEYGNVINSNVDPQQQQQQHDDEDSNQRRDGWWQNRMRRPRSHRA